VPAALLAARFLSVALLPWWPRLAWTGASVAAAVALFCAVRLHRDGTRLREGVEWAYGQLRERTGAVVVTDPRTAEMLRFRSGYALPYVVRAYRPSDPPPEPGVLLLDDHHRVFVHEAWDGVSPPAWWRGSEPPRSTLAEWSREAPWRLRGPSGPPDRVVLSRLSERP
jgi:hypothetical protein